MNKPLTLKQIFKIPDEVNRVIALHGFVSRRPFSELTETEKIIRAVEDLEMEVNNGGFHQYFYNSAGDHWQDCLVGLEKVGASKTGLLFKSALSIFNEASPPEDRLQRQEVAGKLKKEKFEFLDQLDQKFYKYEDNLTALLFKYVEKHREDFYNPSWFSRTFK